LLKNKYFVFILFFFLSCSTINSHKKSEEKYNNLNYNGMSVLSCNIFEELENNKIANKKFKGVQLNIFMNVKKEWINDISKHDWLTKNKEKKDKIKTNFKKTKKMISFTLEKFYTKEKRKIESADYIEIHFQSKLLIFKKLYYNFDQEIFFDSSIYGICDFN